MLNIGTIGSSWITEKFIQAIQLSNTFHLKAVYSRSIDNGRDIAEVYQADYYTDELNNLIFDPEVDVIYIASPNALHFPQAMKAIKAGKHCIIEKPMFTSVDEWHQAMDMADKMGVLVFEAAKHVHNRNYKRMKQIIQHKLKDPEQPFLGANLNLGKYNDQYVQYLAAKDQPDLLPNVFNPAMKTGNLMDLGVYPIYLVVDLFGMPESLSYRPIRGHNGVDLLGTIRLDYTGFQINIFCSMVSHSILPSEFYFDDETILVYELSKISQVELIDCAGASANLVAYTPENQLYDEAVAFCEMLRDKDKIEGQVRYESYKQLSLQVTQVMELLRQSMGRNSQRG